MLPRIGRKSNTRHRIGERDGGCHKRKLKEIVVKSLPMTKSIPSGSMGKGNPFVELAVLAAYWTVARPISYT